VVINVLLSSKVVGEEKMVRRTDEIALRPTKKTRLHCRLKSHLKI
jgi:hypothetical protein